MRKILLYSVLLTAGMLNQCTVKDMALDKKNLDPDIDPGNNFYLYANGGWLEAHPLPDEYSRYGSFDKLAEDNQKMVRNLVEEAAAIASEPGSIHQKVGDFFASGMDSAAIEETGIKPLRSDFDLLAMAHNVGEIQNLLFNYHSHGHPVLFYLFGSPDKKNSKMMIANIYQGGLGLTDVDYYTSEGEKAKKIQSEYRKYISDMLTLAGEEGAESKAEIIYKMEERLARSSMTRLERRDPHKTYNKMDLPALSELSPNIDWAMYFRSCKLEIDEVNVAQPEFFSEVSKMIKDIPLEHWKIYLKWHLINDAAPYLSSNFLQRNFEFYGNFLSGKKSLQPAWKRVLLAEDGALGEAIGQMFVEKHFPPEAKERMLDLVENLRLALGKRIDELDWMGRETKEKAKEKLAAMNVKIGYPDKWKDYSELHIVKDSYFTNLRNSMAFNFEYQMEKIGKEVDPDEWGMTPQTVNAYYSPGRNEIVFPAGILQPPFFYMDADDAVNYGAIGMVIGHEMTHGFDDQGRQYGKDGNLTDWWTSEDAERFEERAGKLVKQYDSYRITDDLNANGQLTLGENIADLGGLNIAFTALKMAWEKNPPKSKINGFSPEQRFFLSYAHVWAGNMTEEEKIRRTKEDVHSLGHLRVNGPLSNMQEFYDAFEVDEKAEMFIPVEQRASIW